MKLVVFAHKPPPLHGQSYMVQLMLEGFGGDRRKARQGTTGLQHGIECYHVNARLSKNMEDVGGMRFAKLFLLVGHCLQAIWCRFRYGASTLYYVPAPGKPAAMYRDWMVMGLCRPFFKRVVFHWHATSLAKWLETRMTRAARGLTYRLMGEADLSIVLSKFNRFSAEKIWPRRIAVVANGIPDPCPQFETEVLPRRQARLSARRKIINGATLTHTESEQAGGAQTVRVLFLAHCTRDKGLFDAVHATLLANEQLRQEHSPLTLRLAVAGSFQTAEEKREFDRLRSMPGGHAIHYLGFLQAPNKAQALREADLLCFPSHWENQPVSVIEALAFGLPTVISRLPSVQEMLPPGYAGVADLKNAEQIAAALLESIQYSDFACLRRHFVEHFTDANFYTHLATELRTLDVKAA
jgi:glycosyltransferase involved in cell wall biosynthesis